MKVYSIKRRANGQIGMMGAKVYLSKELAKKACDELLYYYSTYGYDIFVDEDDLSFVGRYAYFLYTFYGTDYGYGEEGYAPIFSSFKESKLYGYKREIENAYKDITILSETDFRDKVCNMTDVMNGESASKIMKIRVDRNLYI